MKISRLALAAPALLAFLCTSCGSETSAAPKKGEAAADPAAIIAKLAAADAADGTTDMIVMKCAGCGLGMDGKKENTLVVEEYSLYFCKPDCKDRFAEDRDTNILALAVSDK